MLLNFVRSMIAMRLLGPGGILMLSNYNETREMLHESTNLGMDTAGIRGISSAYEEWRKGSEDEKPQLQAKVNEQVVLFRSWVLMLAGFGSLVCLLLAAPLSFFTFQDYDHTWGYALLSPAVGLATLNCGEMVVLKALRKLKLVAAISVIDVLLAIGISLPLFYLYGKSGILAAILALGLAQFLIVSAYSYRVYAPKFAFNKELMRKGIPMIILGISFALSGLVAHCAQLGINAYITHAGGEAAAGLFRSAYEIVMIYAGSVVFASVGSDYFPRLAGVFQQLDARRTTVWRQVRVTFLLMIPVVLLLEAALPWLIQFLSDEFTGVTTTARIASLALIFRAAYLPLRYIPLAAGDSKTFLSLETISYAVLAGGVIAGYQLFGMEGAGWGLVVASAIDLPISYFVAKLKYKI